MLTLEARQAAFAKKADAFQKAVNGSALPVRRTPAGTTIFRFVPSNPSPRLDYFDLFRQLPPGDGSGSDSSLNRWSGRRADGITRGVSASYWGSTDGITAENFFYSCLRGYNPHSGPRRILPSLTPLLVAGVNERQPFYAEEGAPKQLPFQGNNNTNILIARTNRDITSVDMDIASDRFQAWNARISRQLKSHLEDLELKDFAEAIGDSEFKELSRLVGNCAYANSYEALTAKSVRQKSFAALGYDPNQANNLVIFGRDNEPFTDKLTGTGVIEIRPDPTLGASASIKPVTVYGAKEERGLILATAGGGAETSSSGPAADIFTSASTAESSDEDGR
jgi:hypothetical protein